jgi:hypothetical protein
MVFKSYLLLYGNRIHQIDILYEIGGFNSNDVSISVFWDATPCSYSSTSASVYLATSRHTPGAVITSRNSYQIHYGVQYKAQHTMQLCTGTDLLHL